MRYVFYSRVAKVERKRRAVRSYKTGPGKDETAVEYEDMGWFAHIEPFAASICLGDAEPTLKAGTRVRMTLEEVDDAD